MPSLPPATKKALLVSARQLAWTAVKLVALGAAAFLMAEGDRLVFWMILLAGILAIRLRPPVANHDVAAALKAQVLLSDMAAAQNLLGHFRFTHVCYGICCMRLKLGAVLSPFVYNVLYRRITREVTQQADRVPAAGGHSRYVS